MKRSITRMLVLTLSMAAAGLVSASELPDEPSMPGWIEGAGTHFELTDSEYLNITLDSSEPIELLLQSMPEMVILSVRPITEATSAQMTLSGFLPLTTYYMYQDDYHNLVEFTADETGSYAFTQDLSSEHVVFVQPRPSTKHISDTATGGDCSSIGNWDQSTKTCTLTTDLTETIQIDGNGITLDGNGHTMTGNGTGNGVHLFGKTAITIVNLNIQNFYNGVWVYSSDGLTLADSAVNSNGSHGIYIQRSNFGTFSGNTIDHNFIGGVIQWSSSGNAFEYNTIGSTRTGIHLRDSGSTTITGNSFADLGLGIYAWYSGPNTIADNNFNSNRSWDIYTNHSEDDVIVDNNSVNEDDVDDGGGFTVWYGHFNTITGNILVGAVGGISLYGAGYNAVSGNVFNSGWYGFRLSFSHYNSIYRNTVESTRYYGIWINESDFNQIYNNNFIENNVEPYVTGVGNAFDLPLPTGGNYWSRFDTPAEGCSDINGDRLCDSPYVFFYGQDNYAWAEQDGWLVPPFNTLPGNDVVVNPVPEVEVTFSEVTNAGDTTVTQSTVNPGPDKSGFKFLGTYYDISTTATYTGTLTICWDYDDEGLTAGKEQSLKVFHWEQGQDWTDVTVSLDTVNNIICAEVSSLSWFAIAYDVGPPVITITTPEAYGLYTVGVALEFSAVDAESGIDHVVGHLYNAAGDYQEVSSGFTPLPEVYDLVVVATDIAGNTAEVGPVFFVVYDPEGGFATGGGWIRPDAESTLPDGRAEFGFVANYVQNSASGNLAFQYQDADLRLKSSSIDWLTISGVSAQFQGTGTINGEGQFTFRVSAKDNGEPGVGVDSFNIRIWEGADTEADPIHKAKNTLAGGDIVVHRR